MGNLLEMSPSNYLLSDVNHPLTILQNCNIHKGSRSEIIKLHEKIIKLGISQGFFVSVTEIGRIFRNSPIENHSSIIETYFSNTKYKKVNYMEVLACLIVYSSLNVPEKVKLALDVFDLDGNEVITRDEMSIMCLSFLRGIALITESAFYSKNAIEKLAEEAFYLADSDPDGMITYEEYFLNRMLEWVQNNQVLSSLFNKTTPKLLNNRRKSLMEMNGFEMANKKSLPFSNNPKVRTSSVSVPERPQKKINLETTLNQFQEYFKKISKFKGKITVKEFYNLINQNSEYHEHSEKLMKKFRNNFNTEISWEELRELLFERYSQRASLNSSKKNSNAKIQRALTILPPILSIPKEEEVSNKNQKIFRSLFEKYDVDKDGFLTFHELKRGLRDKFSDQTIERLFSENDSNNKGYLNLQDFMRLCA